MCRRRHGTFVHLRHGRGDTANVRLCVIGFVADDCQCRNGASHLYEIIHGRQRQRLPCFTYIVQSDGIHSTALNPLVRTVSWPQQTRPPVTVAMSESVSSTYPEPPSKKRNDIAIELISGSVGGAAQVLSGQVSEARRSERSERSVSQHR
jgi:hypothetical protein